MRDIDGCLCTGGVHYANTRHQIVPASPLLPHVNAQEDGDWYAVTKGRHVGVYPILYVLETPIYSTIVLTIRHSALTLDAVSGVPSNSSKKFSTQTAAVIYFNSILALGIVGVVTA